MHYVRFLQNTSDGCSAESATPLGVTSIFYGGTSSRLLRMTRTGQPGTLYQYDALGNPTATALDVDADGQIDYAGDDRISANATRHESINGDWWRVTTQSIWHEAGVDACLTTGVSRVRLTGFGGWDDTYGGNLTARSETLDARGNVMRSSTYTDAAMPSAWQVLERPDSIQPALSYSVAGRPVLTVTATSVTNHYAYDGFARRTVFTDGRGNTTVTHYNALGQEQYTENAAGNRTTYGYDALGRRTSESDALTNTVHKAYDSLGNTVSVWGAAYPVEQGYDTQGRKVLMKTFRDEVGAGDETRWLYDNATGLLTNKVYADGKGTAYTYTPDGNLATRTWARGVITSYDYDNAGSLTNIAYSDNTQPVSFTLDRLGLQKVIIDATGIHVFTFNDMMQLVAETNDFAALNRTYDELGRSGGYQVAAGEAGAQVVAYVYSDRGRFSSLSSAIPTASNLWNYTYLANSESISGWSNGIVTTVKCFETNRNLFTQVRHAAVETLISQFDYENDELGRRTRRLDTGSAVATNLFAYDARSQLTYAAMKDNEFAWGFDAIGNRVRDISNSVTHGYSVNALNQYKQITNGGVRNLAYDLDGNLTNDSVYAYVWDGENRLVGVNGGGVVAVHKYDNMSRRVEKTVNAVTNRFIYDGWNLIAETSTAGVTNFYVWGADLSGSLQGAGGIGGLLAVIRNGQTYYPVADANGNITDYVDANGAIVAHREFDAFGITLVATGPMVDDFNFWFSSKYLDQETGLYYYGYRFYASDLGRWLSRDPIGEDGGLNLFGFAGNEPVAEIDPHGDTVLSLEVQGTGESWLEQDLPGEWRKSFVSPFRLAREEGRLGLVLAQARDPSILEEALWLRGTKVAVGMWKFEAKGTWCDDAEGLPSWSFFKSNVRVVRFDNRNSKQRTIFESIKESPDGPSGQFVSLVDQRLQIAPKTFKTYAWDAPRLSVPYHNPSRYTYYLWGDWRIVLEDAKSEWEAKVSLKFCFGDNASPATVGLGSSFSIVSSPRRVR